MQEGKIYMSRKYTEAQKKAVDKYKKNNECIRFFAPKGYKEKALKRAHEQGFKKLGPYIIDLIDRDEEINACEN